jgi:hypothetical protein
MEGHLGFTVEYLEERLNYKINSCPTNKRARQIVNKTTGTSYLRSWGPLAAMSLNRMVLGVLMDRSLFNLSL